MKIDGYGFSAPNRADTGRVTVLPAQALIDAGADAPEEVAKTLETLRTMGAMAARVVESKPGNIHVLDFSGTRVTLKLAQSFAVDELVAVILGGTAAADAGTPRGDVQLSSSGRLINAALNPDAAEETAAGTQALLKEAPADIQKLSMAVREAVRDSGIFYESHLATWIDGKTTLDELRQEPKALLGRQLDNGETLSPQLAALMRRQLDALETRSVEWRGELWPGQSGELAIAEDGRGDSEAGDRPWSTRIRLVLPRLGEIEARISLRGNQVSLAMSAASPAVPELQSAGAGLREALALRGLATGRMEVAARG